MLFLKNADIALMVVFSTVATLHACARAININDSAQVISLRAFTDFMKISLRFEILLRSNWPKWNLHRSEFHFAWTHVNADNEVI